MCKSWKHQRSSKQLLGHFGRRLSDYRRDVDAKQQINEQ